MNRDPIVLKVLKAGNGDCLLLSFFDESKNRRTIVMDGGNNFADYKNYLKQEIAKLASRRKDVDLLIISHIDQDHIKGIVYLTRDLAKTLLDYGKLKVQKYWFNSPRSKKVVALPSLDISQQEMEDLERYLHQFPDSVWNISDKIIWPSTQSFFGTTITVLSPDLSMMALFENEYQNLDIGAEGNDYKFSMAALIARERKNSAAGIEKLDNKLSNATSIAFLWERGTVAILFLGDAVPSVIDHALAQLLKDRNLQRLKVTAVKLAHHASQKSLSNKFLRLVECNKFIVSCNGKKANLPNKYTLAKILAHPDRSEVIDFYFNFSEVVDKLKISDQEKADLKFRVHGSNYKHGYQLSL